MLKDIIDFTQTVLTLVKDMERNTTELKKLREDFLEMTLLTQRLSDEIVLAGQHEKGEREKLALELRVATLEFEKRMLEFEKYLPPPGGAGRARGK